MAVLKWADLFSFDDPSDLQKAIKGLQAIDKAYKDFVKTTSAGSAKTQQNMNALVKSLDKVLESTIKLSAANKKDQSEIEKTNSNAQALSATYQAQKKEIASLNAQIKKLTKERAAVSKKTQEVNNINKEAIKLEAQIGKATGKSAKEVAELKLQLTTLRRARTEEAKEAAGLVTIYDKQVKRLAKLTKEYKAVAFAEGTTSKRAKALSADLTKLRNKIKGVEESAGQGTRSVGLYGKSIMSATKQIAGALGLTSALFLVIDVFKKAFNTVVEFDKEMVGLAAILGDTRQGLFDIEKEIRAVAKSSINTATEVAKTATALVTLGASKKEVLDLLEPVNNLAIALKAPADEAGELLFQTLNAFGESSKSAQKYADIIAKMRTSTALDFQRIKDALGFLAPTAKAAGVSFEETGALLGVLVNNGIKASRAGRLLSSSFLKLADEGKTLEDGLDEINRAQARGVSETELLSVASQLLGKESAALGLILADNRGKTAELSKEFENAAGTLDALTKAQLKSLDAQLKILNSTWTEFILSISNGEGVLAGLAKGLIDTAKASIGLAESIGSVFSETDFFQEGRELAKDFSEGLNAEGLGSSIEFYRNRIISTIETIRKVNEENLKLGNNVIAHGKAFKALNDDIERSQGVLDVLLEREKELSKEVKKTTEELGSGTITLEEYEKAMKKLVFTTSDATGEVARFNQEVSDATAETNLYATALESLDRSAAKARDFLAVLDDIENLDPETAADWLAEDDAAFADATKAAEAYFDTIEGRARLSALAVRTGADIISTVGNQLFTNAQINRDNDFAAFRTQKEQELQLVEGNAQATAAIQQQIAERERQERAAAAKAQKKQAIFNILLSTAQAVVAAIAPPPLGLGPVAGIPFAIAAGALGAVQLAAVASQPAAFEKGGYVDTDAPIITSEKGREMFVDKYGKLGMTGNKGAEVQTGMKGSTIIPNQITEAILKDGFSDKSTNEETAYKVQKAIQREKDRSAMIMIETMKRENDFLTESFTDAIKNIKTYEWNLTHGQLKEYVRDGNTRKNEWLRKNKQ